MVQALNLFVCVRVYVSVYSGGSSLQLLLKSLSKINVTGQTVVSQWGTGVPIQSSSLPICNGSKSGSSSSKSKSSISWKRDSSTSTLFPAAEGETETFMRRGCDTFNLKAIWSLHHFVRHHRRFTWYETRTENKPISNRSTQNCFSVISRIRSNNIV